MHTVAIGLLAAFLWFFWLVNRTAANSLRQMLGGASLLQRVEGIDDPEFRDKAAEIEPWLERHGYEPECSFLARTMAIPMNCAAWRSRNEGAWVLLYCARGHSNVDFVTVYEGAVSISTASSRDALLLPPVPGSYVQAFPGSGMDDRRAKHLQACRRLESAHGGLSPVFADDLPAEIGEALSRQARYVMSLPLWRMRGFFWYFLRRRLLANKPAKIA